MFYVLPCFLFIYFSVPHHWFIIVFTSLIIFCFAEFPMYFIISCYNNQCVGCQSLFQFFYHYLKLYLAIFPFNFVPLTILRSSGSCSRQGECPRPPLRYLFIRVQFCSSPNDRKGRSAISAYFYMTWIINQKAISFSPNLYSKLATVINHVHCYFWLFWTLPLLILGFLSISLFLATKMDRFFTTPFCS